MQMTGFADILQAILTIEKWNTKNSVITTEQCKTTDIEEQDSDRPHRH